MSILTVDEIYQGYLAKVYKGTQGYYHFTHDESKDLAKINVCITYGELLYPSVKKILKQICLSSHDIFLDLGSGLGKLVFQIFMQSEVQKVIGIEAAKPLVEQAKNVEQQIKADFPLFWENERELSFICDNFLNADWLNASVVYTCSTCFTQTLLKLIGEKINQHPRVQQVLSLRPIPNLDMPLKKVFQVECSWDSALCFYYGRPQCSR